ncbi:MAG TPA: serine/threonine-protein kinase [Polyangiales bacterium]
MSTRPRIASTEAAPASAGQSHETPASGSDPHDDDTGTQRTGDGSETGVACNQKLGAYRLCFEVARGGMATVYLARKDGAAGFGKLFALKRIHPHLARERAFVEMFLDEARIASQLSHPNVCGVTDFGEADDSYYLAMEYLVGEPLAQLLAQARTERRAMPVAIACRIVADACEGIHSAHELCNGVGEPLHIVHRDISPHNLFVTFDGAVKVVDFGVASAAGRLHHTKTGSVKGKFAYVAPESIEGRPVDRRADVWALGVVLWETLTSKRLFRGKSESETLFAVMQRPIPSVSDVRAGIPAELDRIVSKALARNPDHRYATAQEMAQDLSTFLAHQREAVTLPDISRFMHELFPGGLTKKRQLLHIAMQVGDGVVPSIMVHRSEDALTSTTNSMSAVVSRIMKMPRGVLPRVSVVVAAVLLGVLLSLLGGGSSSSQPKKLTSSAASASPPSAALRPKANEGEGEPSAPAAASRDANAVGSAATQHDVLPTVAPAAGLPKESGDTPANMRPASSKAAPAARRSPKSERPQPRLKSDRLYRRD